MTGRHTATAFRLCGSIRACAVCFTAIPVAPKPRGNCCVEIPFALLLLIALFTAGYAFPLLSQFDNSVRGTLKNALILSLGYLPRTIVITALNVFPFVLLFFNTYLFLTTGFIWVFLYFAAAAVLNAKLLEKVFAPYREEKKEGEE